MINKVVPHLLTYPRSGMHFFDDNLYEIEKIHFTQSHFLEQLFDKNKNKQRIIITIARDPINSITSYVAHNHYDYPNDKKNFLIREKMTEYVLMYAFLCEHADYVIDFNDLIKYPKLVIKKILELLKIDKNEYHYFNRNIVPRNEGYLESSKSAPSYKENMLDGFDLGLCYYYYHKLLENKIII